MSKRGSHFLGYLHYIATNQNPISATMALSRLFVGGCTYIFSVCADIAIALYWLYYNPWTRALNFARAPIWFAIRILVKIIFPSETPIPAFVAAGLYFLLSAICIYLMPSPYYLIDVLICFYTMSFFA